MILPIRAIPPVMNFASCIVAMGERATSGSRYSGRNSVMAPPVCLHRVKHDASVHFGGV